LIGGNYLVIVAFGNGKNFSVSSTSTQLELSLAVTISGNLNIMKKYYSVKIVVRLCKKN